MISFNIARLIQRTVKDELQTDIRIVDDFGNLLSDPYNSTVSDLCFNLALEADAPYVIPVLQGQAVSCYIVCDKTANEETIMSIRMFAQALFNFSQRQTGVNMKVQAESILAMRLLENDAPLYRNDILSVAAGMGYHLEHPMAVVVTHLETNYNYCLNMDLGYESATDDAKLSIISVLKKHPFMNNHDLIAFVANDYLVVFKAIEELNNLSQLYEVQKKVMTAVDEILRPYQIFSYYIAAGRIAESFDRAYISYQEAINYIKYAKSTNIDHPIITWDDILYDSVIRNLPNGYYIDVIEPCVKKMLEQNPGMVEGLIQCFDCYTNNGFNVAAIAKDLYLHRNTVKKRIDKIHKLTGYDPRGDLKNILIIKLIFQQYQLEFGKGK